MTLARRSHFAVGTAPESAMRMAESGRGAGKQECPDLVGRHDEGRTIRRLPRQRSSFKHRNGDCRVEKCNANSELTRIFHRTP